MVLLGCPLGRPPPSWNPRYGWAGLAGKQTPTGSPHLAPPSSLFPLLPTLDLATGSSDFADGDLHDGVGVCTSGAAQHSYPVLGHDVPLA
jgi:hypothetical protein